MSVKLLLPAPTSICANLGRKSALSRQSISKLTPSARIIALRAKIRILVLKPLNGTLRYKDPMMDHAFILTQIFNLPFSLRNMTGSYFAREVTIIIIIEASIYRINAKWRSRLAAWPVTIRHGWIGIIQANKANEIQSLYRIRMTRKPHCRYRPIGNRSTRRRSCSKPVEDYQTAKRCFVVTNNKHNSSSEQRGEGIKRLINDSRKLMMDFKSVDIDSTKPSRSRGYRGRTDKGKGKNRQEIESFNDGNAINIIKKKKV